jgi:hypothetical protein
MTSTPNRSSAPTRPAGLPGRVGASRLRITIDAELHDRLSIRAGMAGMSVADLVGRMLASQLAAEDFSDAMGSAMQGTSSPWWRGGRPYNKAR